MARDGLLVDFGGVLTTNVFESFAAFCRDEGLDPEAVRGLFRQDPAAREALGDLETGRVTDAEFEARFAPMLGVAPAEGLISRLFARMQPDERMFDGVAAAKRAGVRTGLVSNSWGEEGYDRTRFAELFDAVVISGEIGIRKPAPEIYALAAERLGRAPERCVFVDDLAGNLRPALEIGMATVLHRDAETTLSELEQHLGVSLR
ncbi:MAG: HAD family phosphatase [Solirubrobacteraceae bacterium]